MTDINRLIASLKRRSAHAKDFGDDITFVKLEDIDALVEALEKAQGMEAYWKTQCRGITDHCEELQARIAELESSTVTVKLPEPFKLAKSSSGLTYYYADEVNEALTAQGIKWEAE